MQGWAKVLGCYAGSRSSLYRLPSGDPSFLSSGSVRSGGFCLLLFHAYTGDLLQGPLLPILPFLQGLAASLRGGSSGIQALGHDAQISLLPSSPGASLSTPR